MIVQACLNGGRGLDFHPRVPITADAIVADAVAAVAAGAHELHFHVRDAEGRETLAPAYVDPLIRRVRAALPGTLISISTRERIEGDDDRRLACISAWGERPDYAAANIAEPGAPAVIERLLRVGISAEASVWNLADAKRLAALDLARSCLRVLVEVRANDGPTAIAEAAAILAELESAGIRRPILLHGYDASAWPLVREAALHRFSTRMGLEDVRMLPDGTMAADNAALVRAAVGIMRPAL
jgi:uncharacterized protein (DUF849 family)